jgi:formiminotetrahydrofolate cyclodeaminase
MGGDLSLSDFIRDLSAPTPAPGAGGALAAGTAMAAALAQMTAAISAERGGSDLDDHQLASIALRASELGEQASGLGGADADAYASVIEAMRIDKDDPERGARVAAALSAAAEPPLVISAVAAEIAELAEQVVIGGRYSVRGDALAGVLLAESACCGATRLVRIDIGPAADPRVAQADSNADRAARARARALAVG